jgi:hypothetical protein
MRSVVAETIDIVIEKSQGALEKISVEDLVIGVFLQGSSYRQAMPASPLLLLVKCRKRVCAAPPLRKQANPQGIVSPGCTTSCSCRPSRPP